MVIESGAGFRMTVFFPMFRSKWKWMLPALIPFAIGFPMANMNSWRPRRVRVVGNPFQVAFSPDGHRLALASHSNSSTSGRVEWWNISAGSRLRQPNVDEHHSFAVGYPSSICFSGDSQNLVCISHGEVKINRWDAQTGRKAPQLGSKDPAAGTAHQAHVAPGSGDITYWTGGSVEQLDAKKGQVKKKVQLVNPEGDVENEPYDQLAFSPDGEMTAWNIISEDTGILVLRDSAGHKKRLPPLLKSSKNVGCAFTCLTFSPDSRFLVAGWNAESYNANGSNAISSRVALWDLTTRTLAAKWTEGALPTGAHAFSPDGAILAAARGDGAISLRDSRTGKLIRLLKTAGTNVQSVAFSPDGQTLASCGSDGALYLWRVV